MEITLSQWLESHNLLKYHEVLLGNDLDTIELVKVLTAEDLKELGVSLGDRKRFSLAIEQLISQSSNLSAEDLSLISALPYVIAYPFRRTLLERHAWTKINLLKDSFLNYLKYLGLLTASEFFNSPIKDKKMVALFQQALAEPSFGSWNQYIRETLQFLQQQDHSFFCEDLLHYYISVESGKKRKLYKGEIQYLDLNGDIQLKKQEATGIGMLINFRNRYLGHGLTLDENDSNSLWNEYYPIFKELLEKLCFSANYLMYKHEHGETFLLQSSELTSIEKGTQNPARVWIENKVGNSMDILPFYVVPGEFSISRKDKEQILAYESYTGKTIKFFSPEGTEKQTSGKILERLNLLLRDKQKELPYSPEQFNKDLFLKRIKDENAILFDLLVSERKIIPGVYQHREQIEIKLREWIGARANIFFIAAEAGSGKTNLLIEIQRQYSEMGYPTMMIRAGRMEKPSLSAQVAYLLNINESAGLHNYDAIAGSQSEPTFIFIDGLNEAYEAELIWQEILSWGKSLEIGSIKFIITSRANSKADLDRFALSEDENHLLYCEIKEDKKGLGSYVFWLTPMDMKEVKGAWESYLEKDKSLYKPLFTFDDIATFDRSLYYQISNPLVLRLFLEVYNGRVLPKKGGKLLHIWQDWFKTFSSDEQMFLCLLTDEIWLKGYNELLLDDLLQHEKLKQYINSDIVNSPYARMKNLGWISRYMKEMNVCLGFTVEGLLMYLLGKRLQQKGQIIDLAYIENILSSENKLRSTAIESFLCEQSLAGDIQLLTALIDRDSKYLDFCLKPLLYVLKLNGVEFTLEKILIHSTDNDWKLIIKLYDFLEELELDILMKDISHYIANNDKIQFFDLSTEVLIKLLPYLYFNQREVILNIIGERELDKDQKENIAFYFTFNGNPKRAIEIYHELYDIWNLDNPRKINKIAAAFDLCNFTDDAFKLYQSALQIILENESSYKETLPMIYFNIARLENNFDEALNFYNKSLENEIKLYGSIHKQVLQTKNAIYSFLLKNNKLELAEKIIDDIKIFVYKGIINDETFKILASYYYYKGNYEEALKFFQEELKCIVNKFGQLSDELIDPLKNIAYCYRELCDYQKGFEYFEKIKVLVQLKIDNKDIQFDYLSNLANFYYQFDKYDETIKILTEIVEFDLSTISLEDYIENNNLMADAYYCLADYNKAIDYYKRCLFVSNNKEKTYSLSNQIAQCYENDNKTELAIEFYSKSIELLNINKDKTEISLIYFRIGYCYEIINDYNNSIYNYKKGYELDKKDYFLFHIAVCYDALDLEIKSFEIRLQYLNLNNQFFESNEDKSDFNLFIQRTKHLAISFGRVNELPIWML